MITFLMRNSLPPTQMNWFGSKVRGCLGLQFESNQINDREATSARPRRELSHDTRTELNSHENLVKYVPLREFCGEGEPLAGCVYLPEDYVKIQKISLQPTRPPSHLVAKILGNQPWHLWGRKTIVLDLDETLFDEYKVVDWASNSSVNDVALRPFHKPFISACKKHFEVVVWTRSSHTYAIKKCKWLGLDDVPLLSGWNDCDHLGAKPLYKLNREASKMLLVDDDKVHLSANPRSQLLISPWNGDINDVELANAIPIITRIAGEPNVQHSLDICLAQSYNYWVNKNHK